MALDPNFLQKFLFFDSELYNARKTLAYCDGPFPSRLTGLCEDFCELVIRKSIFRDTDSPEIYLGDDITLSVEQLCDMIPGSQNNYWIMTTELDIVEDYLYYNLTQLENKLEFVKLKVKLTDFNKFLTWLFSYIDKDCAQEWNKTRSE